MHNLHLILVNADSAEEAASTVENEILHWGDENNWRRIGGIASEDGKDDVENHDSARWPLLFLDGEDMPKEGTYFSRMVAYLHAIIREPVTFPYRPYETYPDIRSALPALADVLRDFNPDTGDDHTLWAVGRNLAHLRALMKSKAALDAGKEIPEFYSWQLDNTGLTDLSEQSTGSRRYLVFLDMHS